MALVERKRIANTGRKMALRISVTIHILRDGFRLVNRSTSRVDIPESLGTDVITVFVGLVIFADPIAIFEIGRSSL
jgi:hypothetical protein